MTMPEGVPNPHHKVCKLQKSLYGWSKPQDNDILSLLIFSKAKAIHGLKMIIVLFLQSSSQHLTIAAVYVDDILITGSNPTAIQLLKHNLHAAFGIKDLGLLHYFLGFEISHLHDGITLT